jgi:Tfp pilus assembly protein PilN
MRLGIQRSLGIRITSGRAVFVELEKTLGRVRMRRAGVVPLRPGGTPSELLRPGDKMFDLDHCPATGSPSGDLGPNGKRDAVVLGLSRRSIVLRALEFPALDQADLTGLLGYEIERHLPFPVDEAWYSFQPLTQEGGKVKVLLAAVRRTDVERDLERLEELGLRATAVDVSACAAVNALLYRERATRGEVVVLIELDEGQAEVSLAREGTLVSARAVAIGDDAVEPLRLEVKRVLEDGPAGPARVALTGGNEELRLRLSEALGLPVEWWSADAAPVDAAAYGLALKGLVNLPLRIDLLPRDRKPQRREPAVLVMFALLVLIGVLGAALAAGAAYRERRTLSGLTQRIAEVKSRAAEVETLKADFARLRQQVQVLDGIAQERGRGLLALRELAGLLPADVVLTEFVLEGGKLQIRGSTAASPSELIAAFERSAFFENAAFTSPIAAQGADRQGFQLQAFVKGTGSTQQAAGSGQPSGTRRQP